MIVFCNGAVRVVSCSKRSDAHKMRINLTLKVHFTSLSKSLVMTDSRRMMKQDHVLCVHFGLLRVQNGFAISPVLVCAERALLAYDTFCAIAW